MRRSNVGEALIGIAIGLMFSGCAVTPPPVVSKSDALARARIDYVPSFGKRLQLPAQKMETGKHDFYNLFAKFPYYSSTVYGINIATDANHMSHLDAQIIAQGAGPLRIEGRNWIRAKLVHRVDYVAATFGRELLEAARTTGLVLQVTSSKGKLEFMVPEWMFDALQEAADQEDVYR